MYLKSPLSYEWALHILKRKKKHRIFNPVFRDTIHDTKLILNQSYYRLTHFTGNLHNR